MIEKRKQSYLLLLPTTYLTLNAKAFLLKLKNAFKVQYLKVLYNNSQVHWVVCWRGELMDEFENLVEVEVYKWCRVRHCQTNVLLIELLTGKCESSTRYTYFRVKSFDMRSRKCCSALLSFRSLVALLIFILNLSNTFKAMEL